MNNNAPTTEYTDPETRASCELLDFKKILAIECRTCSETECLACAQRVFAEWMSANMIEAAGEQEEESNGHE